MLRAAGYNPGTYDSAAPITTIGSMFATLISLFQIRLIPRHRIITDPVVVRELRAAALGGDALGTAALPSNGLPLKELRRYPLISQFQGSDHDVQQIFKKARIRPKMKYVLDDDISVMGLVSQNEGIALMPEMMLRTAGFDLIAIPLDPPQHRTIGLATLPIKETTLLVRTFVAFCRGLKEWS